VTCRFEAGKVTAIIGPSGCGKSTLLLIARGLLAPSHGRLRFVKPDGRTTAARSPAMATVWQAFNLFPWRTVLDNVTFGLEVAGVPRAERTTRARGALAKVDLAGFETKYPRQLSGGMRQRVGLARALVMDPEVLLLDEPFGALDAQTRLVLQEQLARLVDTSGTTAVLTMETVHDTDVVFEAIGESGLRATIGKCMMDFDAQVPARLREDTRRSIDESVGIRTRWHGAKRSWPVRLNCSILTDACCASSPACRESQSPRSLWATRSCRSPATSSSPTSRVISTGRFHSTIVRRSTRTSARALARRADTGKATCWWSR
jgi:NitT/TauT family transport system ATP-binding protein